MVYILISGIQRYKNDGTRLANRLYCQSIQSPLICKSSFNFLGLLPRNKKAFLFLKLDWTR